MQGVILAAYGPHRGPGGAAKSPTIAEISDPLALLRAP